MLGALLIGACFAGSAMGLVIDSYKERFEAQVEAEKLLHSHPVLLRGFECPSVFSARRNLTDAGIDFGSLDFNTRSGIYWELSWIDPLCRDDGMHPPYLYVCGQCLDLPKADGFRYIDAEQLELIETRLNDTATCEATMRCAQVPATERLKPFDVPDCGEFI